MQGSRLRWKFTDAPRGSGTWVKNPWSTVELQCKMKALGYRNIFLLKVEKVSFEEMASIKFKACYKVTSPASTAGSIASSDNSVSQFVPSPKQFVPSSK